MNEEFESADLDQSFNDEEVKHQDGYLGPQQRYLSLHMHWSFDSTDEWSIL